MFQVAYIINDGKVVFSENVDGVKYGQVVASLAEKANHGSKLVIRSRGSTMARVYLMTGGKFKFNGCVSFNSLLS